MAEVLKDLGSEKAWLVHGDDGSDEVSICGATQLAKLEGGTITGGEIHPEDAGLPVHPLRDILGGLENGRAFAALLDGAPSAYRDAVLLNALARLWWRITQVICAQGSRWPATVSTAARPRQNSPPLPA